MPAPLLLPLLLACAHTPEGDCQRLLDALCDNAHRACDLTADECMAEIEEGYACAEVRKVSEDLEACLDAVDDSHQCLMDGQLPGACAGVLIY